MKFYLFGLLFFISITQGQGQKTCHIKGQLIGKLPDTILLLKQVEDFNNAKIAIPVGSLGKFEYDLKYDETELYYLVVNSEFTERRGWNTHSFFTDTDSVEVVIYPMGRNPKTHISGSTLTDTLYNRFNKRNAYYLPKFNAILEKLGKYQDTSSVEHKKANQERAKHERQFVLSKFSDFSKQYDLCNYSRFLDVLRSSKYRMSHYTIDTLTRHQAQFEARYPNHSYSRISKMRVNALRGIKVGNPYVDFSSKDGTGRTHDLSQVISQNKYTLIDLWAPWCGPCIYKSKKVIPIYREFKNKGFEVFGVVGYIDSIEEYKALEKKYAYPWLLTYEKDQEYNLWNRYNIFGAGGGQFLVDQTGTIVAINPSSKELKHLLENIK